MTSSDPGVPAAELDEARAFGAAVFARRRELDLTAADVQKLGGPSISALSHIENGRKPLAKYSPGLLSRLERPLRWESGSVGALRRGEAPTTVQPGRRPIAVDDGPGEVIVHRPSTRGLDVMLPALRALSPEEQREALEWLESRLQSRAS